MTTTVQHSDCKVIVTIECSDSNHAARVAAELATEVNSGKFKYGEEKPREPRPDPMKARYDKSREDARREKEESQKEKKAAKE
jgi:hypothetical protein